MASSIEFAIRYSLTYQVPALCSSGIKRDSLCILREDNVVCAVTKLTAAEYLRETGSVQLNTKEKRSFRMKHFINGASQVIFSTYIDGSITDLWYAQKNDQRTPRRFTTGNITELDYLMNTYSTDPIPDSVFTLPDYCTSVCPATTICGKFQSKGIFSYEQ